MKFLTAFPTLTLSLFVFLLGQPTLHAADVHIDGSSTVYPITVAIAGKWHDAGHQKIEVAQNGSGAGIKLLIAGTIPFADSSRAMTKAEVEIAAGHGIDIIEVPIAMDGITVVVNVDNTFVPSLSTKQLKAIWSPGSSIMSWAQVAPGFPDQPMALYRPGNNSGTLEYFTSQIVGKAGAIRQDSVADEDFSVLTQGVIANRYALSFCGWAYARSNAGMLRQVPIDNGNGSGPQAPNHDSIIAGTYPLSRPLFIYLNKAALSQPEVGDFVAFYLSQVGKIADQVGYVPLPDTLYAQIRERVAKHVTGSPFSMAPKGTSIEKALAGNFIAVGSSNVAPMPSTSPTTATTATTTTSVDTPVLLPSPGPENTTSSSADRAMRIAGLNRLRDASLTLARLSLSQTATLEELSRSAQETRAAIDDLRSLSDSGLAPSNLTLAQVITGPVLLSDESYGRMVDHLRLRSGSKMQVSDEALEDFKRDLRGVHDGNLRSQLAMSLSHVTADNLPVFVESVAKIEGGSGWRAIDVVSCYARGDWTMQ